MTRNIAELVGLFLVIIGCGCVVGAASMISIALAVLAAGVFLLFAGTVTVYVANASRAATAPAPRREL